MTRRCTKCKETKALDAFPKHKSCRDGIHTQCRLCVFKYNTAWRMAHKTDYARYAKNYREKYPEKVYPAGRTGNWRKVGLAFTFEEYEALLLKQDSKCAICKTPASEFKIQLCVDHDHETKLVRGLLCTRCNTGLGKFQDDAALLRAAQVYLEDQNGLD